jgi:hypothetical protein
MLNTLTEKQLKCEVQIEILGEYQNLAVPSLSICSKNKDNPKEKVVLNATFIKR